MYFELHTPYGLLTEENGKEMLRFIERNARISHRSEDRQTDDSYQRFIQDVVIGHGDWSVVEHASLTAMLRLPRGITHELVRHRLFSYTQESTRFVNYTKHKTVDIEVITPTDLNPDNKQIWDDAVAASRHTYEILIQRGEKPQTARGILPIDTAANISMTGNLRSWRWFLLARTTRETHTDMRAWTIPALAEFKRCIPLIYDDIEPMARQIDNARKAH